MRPPQTTFLQGEASEILRTLPDESVHCIVSSPPYYALRDYRGEAEQLGQEKTPGAFIHRLTQICAEARRVLRRDGTLWLNLGDTYANKQLLGIPWRAAMALQNDGWYLRTEIIWEKSNACPESSVDRPNRSHEYVFLLSRSRRYYYDRIAVLQPNAPSSLSKKRQAAIGGDDVLRTDNGSYRFRGGGAWANNRDVKGGFVSYNPRGRNLRSCWRIPTRPFFPKSVGVDDVTHFAAMAPDLARMCIRAGTSAGGVCAACGAPQMRILATAEDLEDTWVPGCQCPPDAGIVPARVLDMFGGTGTTAAVANEEGCDGIYIDLSPDYLRLARARVAAVRS